MKNFLSVKTRATALWVGLRNAALAVIFIGLGATIATPQAPPPDGDVAGATVLTRGPVHEAFAGVVSYNPEPGIVCGKEPPAPIEEMPPEEKPEGDNITWIPGYWAWDDERNDFLWVSGTWRALPPGREWRAGYWTQTSQGYQWISGYWADTAVQETTYLPAPPASVEVGPNIAAPDDNYVWIPGCWVWLGGHYAWQPGYWAPGRPDWDWFPSYYAWTPRGYVFVNGYWDYPVIRRGCVFAPVYFEPRVYVRRGFYSPRIVIGFDAFHDHLFVRPRYCHYYFGDYYAASYISVGFYASFSFQLGHHGYDPIFCRDRWDNRRDRDWERRIEVNYRNRRDHVEARPPRTWAEERNIRRSADVGSRDSRVLAMPVNRMAERKDGPVKFQPVAQPERQQLAQREQQIQKFRDERRTSEAKGGPPVASTPGARIEPAKVQLPRSPIVAKQANQLRGNEAPPNALKSPKPDPNFRPQGDRPNRQGEVNLSNPKKPDSDKQPRRPEAQPDPKRSRETKTQEPRGPDVQPQRTLPPEAQPRPRPPEAKPQEPRPAESLPQPTRPPEAQPRPRPPEAKPQVPRPAESLPQPRSPEAKPQERRPPEAQPRALPPEAKPQPTRPPEAQPRALPPEAKPQPTRPPEAQPRPLPPEAQPRPRPPEAQPQQPRPSEARPQPTRPAEAPKVQPRPRPDMNERGASRLMRNDRDQSKSNKDK